MSSQAPDKVWTKNGWREVSHTESAELARLRAINADLLEALESALACMNLQQTFERGRGDPTAKGWDAPITVARAAIAKAEGK